MSETSHSEQCSTKEKETKVCTASLSNLKSVSPKDRCLQFSHKCFAMSGRKLFCSCCREEVSLKLSSIKNYIDSIEHKASKDKEAKKYARQNFSSAFRS